MNAAKVRGPWSAMRARRRSASAFGMERQATRARRCPPPAGRAYPAPVRRPDTAWLPVVLLATPAIWGASFPASKVAMESLDVFPFMAWCRVLGLLTMVLVVACV